MFTSKYSNCLSAVTAYYIYNFPERNNPEIKSAFIFLLPSNKIDSDVFIQCEAKRRSPRCLSMKIERTIAHRHYYNLPENKPEQIHSKTKEISTIYLIFIHRI